MAGVPDQTESPSFVTVLTEAECDELVSVAIVGRIGFSASGRTAIMPVIYRVGAERRIFINTNPAGIVAGLAAEDADVAFEVDYHASDFGIAWSVLMNGTLSLLDGEARSAYNALRLPPRPWPGLSSTLTVQFRPDTASGRELHRH